MSQFDPADEKLERAHDELKETLLEPEPAPSPADEASVQPKALPNATQSDGLERQPWKRPRPIQHEALKRNSDTRIKLRRKSCIAGCFDKIDILVDGEKIGNIANGKEQRFEVTPGQHAVQVRVALPFGAQKSKPIDFDLSPNGSIELECGISPQSTMRWLLFGLLGLLTLFWSDGLTRIGLEPLAYITILLWGLWCTYADLKRGGSFYLKKLNDGQGED